MYPAPLSFSPIYHSVLEGKMYPAPLSEGPFIPAGTAYARWSVNCRIGPTRAAGRRGMPLMNETRPAAA